MRIKPCHAAGKLQDIYSPLLDYIQGKNKKDVKIVCLIKNIKVSLC